MLKVLNVKNTRNKGDLAEKVALFYLQDRGYKLIQTNYRNKKGEIDIIMSKGDFIVFIEVKSLSVNSSYSIYERLSFTKKQRIKRTIQNWLLENKMQEKSWRFDFIGVIASKVEEHFEFVSL